MARIRTIKPELPQSESIGRVSRDARLTFIHIIGLCDDEGRTRGAPALLAGQLFPYDRDAPDLIGGWLAELVRERLIQIYEVDGTRYLSVVSWAKHQKVDKPTRSRLPSPPAQKFANFSGGLQTGFCDVHAQGAQDAQPDAQMRTSDAQVAHPEHPDMHDDAQPDALINNDNFGSPSESAQKFANLPEKLGPLPRTSDRGSKKTHAQPPAQDAQSSELVHSPEPKLFADEQGIPQHPPPKPSKPRGDFDAFWKIYPRRVGKGRAQRAYAKALRQASHDTIMAGLARAMPALLGADVQYQPHPATWLNDERWTDELSADATQAGASNSDEHWRLRVEAFESDGAAAWMNSWGPKPGEPGCKAPANLLHRHRCADAQTSEQQDRHDA